MSQDFKVVQNSTDLNSHTNSNNMSNYKDSDWDRDGWGDFSKN